MTPPIWKKYREEHQPLPIDEMLGTPAESQSLLSGTRVSQGTANPQPYRVGDASELQKIPNFVLGGETSGTLGDLIADIEAASSSSPCEKCTHPSCERYRLRSRAARLALEEYVTRIQRDLEIATAKVSVDERHAATCVSCGALSVMFGKCLKCGFYQSDAAEELSRLRSTSLTATEMDHIEKKINDAYPLAGCKACDAILEKLSAGRSTESGVPK